MVGERRSVELRLLADDPAHQPVLLRLLGVEPEIAGGVVLDPLDRLTGLAGKIG